MIKLLGISSFTYSKNGVDENQDCILPFKREEDGFMIAVADGVGGYDGGLDASSLAVSQLEKNTFSANRSDVDNFFHSLKQKLKELSKDNPIFFAAATTLTFCHISKKGLMIGHCGDSRLYLKVGNKLVQITKDQTQHQILIDKGLYTPRQLRNLMGGNVLTSAISAKLDLEYQVIEIPTEDLPLQNGNVNIFIMSDGAHYHWEGRPRFSEKTMDNPSKFAASLQKRIETKGPHDDFSLVCIKVSYTQ
ncbi:protein phosphatase 2C domain-containing protein [Klebsiella pneumoniae]|nr:protein phosphatase 2C domain-containing protein [Klebsiella pneumoniae]HCI6491703.1 protein phosphatase 2C domain-containing protein [Klebsiella pneumoniae]